MITLFLERWLCVRPDLAAFVCQGGPLDWLYPQRSACAHAEDMQRTCTARKHALAKSVMAFKAASQHTQVSCRRAFI